MVIIHAPDYDHFYIPLASNKANSSHNPFSINPSTVVLVKISGKKHQFSQFETSLPFPKWEKYWYENMSIWCYQGYFQIKLPLFSIFQIKQYSVWYSSCKNTFVAVRNLQMITNKVWLEYLCIVSGLSFV